MAGVLEAFSWIRSCSRNIIRPLKKGSRFYLRPVWFNKPRLPAYNRAAGRHGEIFLVLPLNLRYIVPWPTVRPNERKLEGATKWTAAAR